MLVSHDRALLAAVCDAFLLVSDGGARAFDGDVEDYLAWLGARRVEKSGASGEPARAERVERRQARAAAAAERQLKLAQRRPLLKESDRLELELSQWHSEKREVDETLADPSTYESPDPDKLKALALRQTELTRLIDEAEHRWLEVNAALDAIGEGASRKA